MRVNGRDNIPAKGGALFVCNHVSFVDALLLIAATDRHVRFMMLKSYYELPYVKPFARALGVIPISSEQRPRDMLKSLQTASDAIKDGHVVCIFAEGQITRIGQLLPFRRGLERIMKDVDAPIVPIALDGVWGSLFSFEKRRFIWKLPHRIPHPVTVSFGSPMSAHATAFEVRQAVQELQASAWHDRRDRMQPLHRAFVKTARRVPFRLAMVGAQTPAVSFSGALVRTVLLARRLRKVWVGQKMVGLLSAALRAGRAGEFRGAAEWQSAGEFELHPFRGGARVVRQAVRNQDRADLPGFLGEGETQSAGRSGLFGGCGWFTNDARRTPHPGPLPNGWGEGG